MLSIQDSGVESIELVGENSDELRTLAKDPRLTVPVLSTSSPGERLLVRSDALIAQALLSELNPGESIVDEYGASLAAKVFVEPGQDPATAFSEATAKTWSPDRYHYALRLNDQLSFRRARRALLASLVKPSDGPVSRHINRPISLAITRLALPFGVTPNQMTVVVALLGLAAAWLATSPIWLVQVLAAFVYQLHSIVDGCDGEIARLTRRFTRYGTLLDSIVDDCSNTLFFVGLSIGVSRAIGSSWPLFTAALVAVSYPIMAVVQYRTSAHVAKLGDKTGFWRSRGADRSKIASLLVAAFRRDVFILFLLVAVVLGLAPAVVAFFPVVTFGALAASIREATRLKNYLLSRPAALSVL
jgi:phosphatidylglycerophosphate synthase